MPPAFQETTFWGLNEVQAVLLVGLAAAAVAIWGILSQRTITARQATLEFIRISESDRDMIAATATFNKAAKDAQGLGIWAISRS